MTIEHRCMYKDCRVKTRPDTDDGKVEVTISDGICDKCLATHFPEEAKEILPESS
jgi:hypothetical protein